MARLSKIVGSILRDMVAAQHEANMYALGLSPAYRNRPAGPNPPAVCLGEIELTLHCGFTGKVAAGRQREVDRTAVLRTLRELASETAEAVVASVLATVARYSDGSEQTIGPLARLNREKKLRRSFIAFLSRSLNERLHDCWAEFIASDGSLDNEKLQELILGVADEKVLAHEELEETFAVGAGALRKEIRENLQTDIRILLPRLSAGVRPGRWSKYASLDVTVSSEELADLPETSIQTLRLTISPRDLPTDIQ